MSASPNIKLFGCSLLLRDQLMSMLGMPKHITSDRLKSACRAVALDPSEHFTQMDHFVFDYSLHRRQSITAFMPTNPDRVARFTERLK